MIVLSLVLVIAAAVSLFIGLFVATTDLTFIFVAIVLCLLSLLLLWLGTRAQRREGPTAPSPPVYGGPARAGAGTTARAATPAVRSPDESDVDELDELTAPGVGEVVRKTTARERATARVEAPEGEAADAVASPAEATAATAAAGTPTAKKATTKKATAKKATSKKATARKSTAKKSTAKKSTAKKATAKKAAAKKSTAKKTAAKKSSGRRTTGAAARARLAEIPGVGPAKQDALLAQYGSLEGIREAPADDIVKNVRGFGQALAERVRDALS